MTRLQQAQQRVHSKPYVWVKIAGHLFIAGPKTKRGTVVSMGSRVPKIIGAYRGTAFLHKVRFSSQNPTVEQRLHFVHLDDTWYVAHTEHLPPDQIVEVQAKDDGLPHLRMILPGKPLMLHLHEYAPFYYSSGNRWRW